MSNESNEKESVLANRILLAIVVMIGSSLLLLVMAHHGGIEQHFGLGPRVGIAMVGVTVLLADRIFVWARCWKSH